MFNWGKGKKNERMVYDKNGISPCMTSAMGMGGGFTPSVIINSENNNSNDIHNCVTQAIGRQGSSQEYIDSCKKVYQSIHKIRRLTPRECFRLMDFDDSFDFSVVSDSQAYKQAGNSIVVAVLYKILKNLKIN